MDALLFIERIKNAIELGESHFREFKSCFESKPDSKTKRKPEDIATDIGRTLVAFANSDGGELFVGVEDNGEITGHDYNEKTIGKLLDAPKNQIKHETPLKNYTAKPIIIDNKEILYFQVEKGTEYIHLTSDGRVIVRDDKQSIPKEIERIVYDKQEQTSLQYDRQFVDGANINDLDLDLIKYVSSANSNSMSEEKSLQFLDLAEYTTVGLKLRKAALLLFAKDIIRWHPRCGVRIVRIIGNELKTGKDYNVKDDIIISENILKLYNKAWDALRPFLAVHKYFPDGKFRETSIYPEEACREALVNAIAHRDYSIEGRLIEILVYDDRMEIKSPGGLLSNIKLDDLRKLKGTHQSRNSKISRVLRETGTMKEMGEGMRRIFQLMQGNELRQPEIITDYSNFSIILNNKSIYKDEDQNLLDSYRNFKLTSDERLIILLGKNNKQLTQKNISTHLGLNDGDTAYLIINKLRTKGILELLESNKSSSSKYPTKKYIIRNATDIELFLIELKESLSKMLPAPYIDNEFIKKLKDSLSTKNIYKNNYVSNLLRNLGYIDDDNIPTKELLLLWPIYKNHDIDFVVNNLSTNTKSIEDVLIKAFTKLKEQNKYIKISEFEKIIKTEYPDFSFLNFGYGRLIDYLRTSKLISIKEKDQQIEVAYDLKNIQELSDNKMENLDFKDIFISTFKKLSKGEGWVYFGQFAFEIKKNYPNFNSINFGYPKLTDMLKNLPDLIEYKYESDRTELFVRILQNKPNILSNNEKPKQLLSVPISLLIETYEKLKDKDNWAYLANMGTLLRKLYPGFNPRNYGFNTMVELIENQNEIFEIRKDFNNNSNQALVYIRFKQKSITKPSNIIPKKNNPLPLTNIKNAYYNSEKSDNNWIKITSFYEQLQKNSKFLATDYGYRNFYEFVVNNTNLFEIRNESQTEQFDIEIKLLFD